MITTTQRSFFAATALVAGIGLLTLSPPPAHAQADPAFPIGDATTLAPPPAASTPSTGTAAQGVVRLARFSYLRGNVTWRGLPQNHTGDDAGDGENEWMDATLNLPVQQGAQIWVSDNSRAELQFDDGSRLRLNANTLVTLQTMYSDSEGEFTEISLSSGETYLRLMNKYSSYQITSPLGSTKATGPARLRIGSGDVFQVGVRMGQASVQGTGDSSPRSLGPNDFLRVTDENAARGMVRSLPVPDEWERWNIARDHDIDGYAQSTTYQSVPVNVSLCIDDLDQYGLWRDDPIYGRVWVPSVTETDWRPYYHGQWTWLQPYGWTWVGAEPWGWAPYHYGTWFHASYGWGWRPGPVTQYWSPAIVSFYRSGNSVAWCPLAPREVYYPASLAQVGFRHGNWSSYFSIGGAASYYPGSRPGEFEPHLWRNGHNDWNGHNGHDDHAIALDRTPHAFNHGQPMIKGAPFSRPGAQPGAKYMPMNAFAGGGSSLNAAQFGRPPVRFAAHGGNTHPAAPSLFQSGERINPVAKSGPNGFPARVLPHPQAGAELPRPERTLTERTLTGNTPAGIPTERPFTARRIAPQETARFNAPIATPLVTPARPESIPSAPTAITSTPTSGQRFRLNGSNGSNGLTARPSSTAVTGQNIAFTQPPLKRQSGLNAYLRDRNSGNNGGAAAGGGMATNPSLGLGTARPTGGNTQFNLRTPRTDYPSNTRNNYQNNNNNGNNNNSNNSNNVRSNYNLNTVRTNPDYHRPNENRAPRQEQRQEPRQQEQRRAPSNNENRGGGERHDNNNNNNNNHDNGGRGKH